MSLNYHFQDEDAGTDIPNWIGFDWTFRDSNEVRLQHKFKAFEKLHPNLTALWADEFNKEKFVLTSEGIIKYSFKVYGITIQYQPSDELFEWLDRVSQSSEYFKNRKEEERKCIKSS